LEFKDLISRLIFLSGTEISAFPNPVIDLSIQ
jgi:hypothetical protein